MSRVNNLLNCLESGGYWNEKCSVCGETFSAPNGEETCQDCADVPDVDVVSEDECNTPPQEFLGYNCISMYRESPIRWVWVGYNYRKDQFVIWYYIISADEMDTGRYIKNDVGMREKALMVFALRCGFDVILRKK